MTSTCSGVCEISTSLNSVGVTWNVQGTGVGGGVRVWRWWCRPWVGWRDDDRRHYDGAAPRQWRHHDVAAPRRAAPRRWRHYDGSAAPRRAAVRRREVVPRVAAIPRAAAFPPAAGLALLRRRTSRVAVRSGPSFARDSQNDARAPFAVRGGRNSHPRFASRDRPGTEVFRGQADGPITSRRGHHDLGGGYVPWTRRSFLRNGDALVSNGYLDRARRGRTVWLNGERQFCRPLTCCRSTERKPVRFRLQRPRALSLGRDADRSRCTGRGDAGRAGVHGYRAPLRRTGRVQERRR